MNTMDIRLQQAIAAARAGKRDEARVLLDRFLADQPDDVQGIFLRSTLASSKEERVEDLHQVLSIDPDHRGAKLMLERLGEPVEVEPPVSVPEEFEPDEVEPGVPEFEEEEFEEEELVDDVPATIVAPIVEPEMEITMDDLELDEDEDEDLPFGDIEATAVVLLAEEVGDEVSELSDWPLEEEVEPVLDETLVVYPDESIFEDDEAFPELEEEEEVPEWLTDEAAFKAEAEIAQEEAIEGEELPLEMGELPDWLQEEPNEEWLSQEQIETPKPVDELPEGWAPEPISIPEDDFAPMPADIYTQPPKKKRKKVSKRALEIVLGLLIILALLVMVGLVYVFFTM